MEFIDYLSNMIAYLRGEYWVIQVFLIIFLALSLDWLQKHMLKKLYARYRKTDSDWDDAILDALRLPLTLLIWLVGVTFAVEFAGRRTGAFVFTAAIPIRDVGLIMIIAWFLLRFIKRAEDNIITRNLVTDPSFDRTSAEAVAKLLRVSVIITASLVVLQALGYSITGVLAFGGVGGIAVAFAARDMLANFFGGMVVYMDRPFSVGDWIRSPDQNIEGTVETIGWRSTCIRTFDKRPLYVPNAIFTTVSVENPSRMTNRRIFETVGIRYDDAGKMAAIVADVKEMVSNHPDIDTHQKIIVNFDQFAASSLNFFVYVFTKTTDWVEYHEIKQDVMLKIIDIIEKHGAECAFPTTTVHIPDGIAMNQSEE